MSLAHPDPIEQVYDSITSTFQTIEAVASPNSDVKLQHLSGPVGIVRIYYLLFESDHGWQLALWFSVILNVNLAILNMLPIPVLDGGHIVLALIEGSATQTREHEILEFVQTGCATDYRLHALHQFLRCRRFVWKKRRQKAPRKESPAAARPTPVSRRSASGAKLPRPHRVAIIMAVRCVLNRM